MLTCVGDGRDGGSTNDCDGTFAAVGATMDGTGFVDGDFAMDDKSDGDDVGSTDGTTMDGTAIVIDGDFDIGGRCGDDDAGGTDGILTGTGFGGITT
jgi:hypothetical protein